MLQPTVMSSKSNNAQLNLNTWFLGHLMQKLRFTSENNTEQYTLNCSLTADFMYSWLKTVTCQGSIASKGRQRAGHMRICGIILDTGDRSIIVCFLLGDSPASVV
jgi:hypothetical protein